MSAIERIRESMARDPDWDDCDVGEAQRVLAALLAVAEAAQRYREEVGRTVGRGRELADALDALAALDAGGGR